MASLFSLSLLLLFLSFVTAAIDDSQFTFHEATIETIHLAFAQNRLTSRQLVHFYVDRVQTLNPSLRCVLELNPDALHQADEADRLRAAAGGDGTTLGHLHGIPVLLKDSIGTDDKLNTSAGSYALLGARVARDAFVVERLRSAGAVILGKASMSEWYSVRSFEMPSGWCARGGEGLNPYVKSGDPCGSSSGSAIAVAANMVAVSLGTETDGSIICPGDHNSVVGFKPTVGLTSRAGVIPLSPRQDSIGPICRSVSDAVHVLDAIVGFDPRDEATGEAAKFIPMGGYKQFLREDGLKGKRLGIVRKPFLDSFKGSTAASAFDQHLVTFWSNGATVVDNLEIENIGIILNPAQSGEMALLLAEFKHTLNEYLGGLSNSRVKSLAEVIAFNSNNPDLEKMEEYNQDGLIAAEMTNMLDEEVVEAERRMKQLSEEGFEKLMKENELDAMVTLGADAATVLAIGGYPALTVPAGYDDNGMPFGICFGGLKGSEAKLIETAYAFEQATRMRKPPLSYSTEFHYPHYQ
ncbi:probable amidase At4g34880 isoform X1 [Rhodamnia argentea]|uniref:Probable amidase At4g34880 isoform X1 n=1 Tax=Rhodamnia argentea TaxID=178133 RepID=A0A8B8N670_9MYRT|nr:probable amidase At4g34880 isoform X1 [Rhodamnia argentea]